MAGLNDPWALQDASENVPKYPRGEADNCLQERGRGQHQGHAKALGHGPSLASLVHAVANTHVVSPQI